MRQTLAETYLSALDSLDRNLFSSLARARGHFTLTDYSHFRGISRQGVYKRLQRHAGILFKRLRPSAANSFPEVYFLVRRFAYTFNPDYQEPRTIHTLLDGLLRTKILGLNEDGEWSHHTRQPSVFVTKAAVHVIDCLDRTPSAILQFAKDLVPGEKVVKIHCGQTQRIVALEYMQNRAQIQSTKPPAPDEEVTWDSLFGERKRALQTSEKHLRSPLIEVVYHDIPAFQFTQVC